MKQLNRIIGHESKRIGIARIADNVHEQASNMKNKLSAGRLPQQAVPKMSAILISLGLNPLLDRERRSDLLADAAMFEDARGGRISATALFNMAAKATRDPLKMTGLVYNRDVFMRAHNITWNQLEKTMGDILSDAGYTVQIDTNVEQTRPTPPKKKETSLYFCGATPQR